MRPAAPNPAGSTAALPRCRLPLALRFAGALALVAVAMGCAAPALAQPAAPAAVVLEVEGVIGPPLAEYVMRELRAAPGRGARLVILRMDTPGGLDSAMRDLIRAVLASPVPVATYVSPSGARAASAGTYILYASHVAAMAPGTNLGAATPVPVGGTAPLPGPPERQKDAPDGGPAQAPAPRDAMSAKVVNDAVAYIRGLAQLHGRNADWAERAVREAVSLSAQEALEQGVVELIARDVPDLLAQAHGRTVRLGGEPLVLATQDLQIVQVPPDWRTRTLALLANPNLAFLLLLLGAYGILFEILNPGAIVPGVVGGICLLVGLFALNLLPVNWAGLALLLLGIGLMTAEALVPSFGILGIGGMVAFALGAILLFEGGAPGLRIALPLVIGATITSGAFFVLALAALVRSRRRAVAAGGEALLGARGEVVAWHGGAGSALVQGERWQARSRHPLSPGDRIKVVAREGLVLTVERE